MAVAAVCGSREKVGETQSNVMYSSGVTREWEKEEKQK